MSRENYWVNDGLAQGFGRRTADNEIPATLSNYGLTKEITFTVDWSDVQVNTAVGTVTSGAYNQSAKLPSGASVIKCSVRNETAAAGAGTTAQVGGYVLDADGALSLGDVDAFAKVADLPFAALSVLGGVMNTATGDYVSESVANLGATPAEWIIVMTQAGGAGLTAGVFNVTIEYIV